MYSPALILSPRSDLHAAAVWWGLRRNGIDAIWASSLADEQMGSLSLRGSADRAWTFGSTAIWDELRTVWFRRPQKPESFTRGQQCDTPFLRREWSEFHDNFYALRGCDPDLLWVNTPQAANLTENKILQLEVARLCGLLFPQTLVSSDPNEIRRFIRQCGRVVYKGFASHTWKDRASGAMYVLWTHLIDSGTVLDDASLSLCPGIYQAYVEKTADIRVTLIGERTFAIRIRPTASKALVDWRQHAVTWRASHLTKAVQADAVSLPWHLESKLKRLMQKLGIVFGCIDLAIGIDGTAYFLEVNQSGEFLFAEEMVEPVPLLQAMCCLLATGRVDYSLDEIGRLSYREYRESEEYQSWWREIASGKQEDLRQRSVIIE